MAAVRSLLIARVINTRLDNICRWLDYIQLQTKTTYGWDDVKVRVYFEEAYSSFDIERRYHIRAELKTLDLVKTNNPPNLNLPEFKEKIVNSRVIDLGGILAEESTENQVVVIGWLDDHELDKKIFEVFIDVFKKEFLFGAPNPAMVEKNLAETWLKKIGMANPDDDQSLLITSSIETKQEINKSVSIMDLLSALKFIEDVPLMKKHYKNFSFETAQIILNAIPTAWERYSKDREGLWGPGKIAVICQLDFHLDITATTVGRYLKAFKEAGLTEIKYNDRTIPIP